MKNKMQIITKRIGLPMLILLISLSMNLTLNAQTPADDPGIGGPGSAGFAPVGDGAPIVPFDGQMSLMLLVSGVCYVLISKKYFLIKV